MVGPCSWGVRPPAQGCTQPSVQASAVPIFLFLFLGAVHTNAMGTESRWLGLCFKWPHSAIVTDRQSGKRQALPPDPGRLSYNAAINRLCRVHVCVHHVGTSPSLMMQCS
ncbi:hypothetical protein V8C44DRAFT_313738 [Trichoderma aethiopicum]